MAPTTHYDPVSYWDEKARRANRDAFLASCSGDPRENECMHRAQQHALDRALERIARTQSLHDSALLDFGCGAGRWTRYFQSFGTRYAGVDISGEMIRLCRDGHPEGHFARVANLRIPFDDATFDCVFSIAVLHHNRLAEQEVLLDEIDRVLRPEGHLFLFEAVGRSHNPRVFAREPGQWEQSLRGRGFTLLGRRRYDYYVLSDLTRRAVWKLRLPWLRSGRRPPALLRADASLSPALSRFVSFGTDVRMAMLARKGGGIGSPIDGSGRGGLAPRRSTC